MGTMSLHTRRPERRIPTALESAEVEPLTEAETVGARLARARAKQGLDIEEVSRRTYIRPGVLRRMEESDFAACGGECYARGQLRILAAVLKMDRDELVFAFDRESAVADPVLHDDVEWSTPLTTRHRTRTALALGLLVLVVLVVLALIANS